jgi:hypothetical protein
MCPAVFEGESKQAEVYKNQPSLGDADRCARGGQVWHCMERTVDVQMIGGVSDHLLIDPLQFG